MFTLIYSLTLLWIPLIIYQNDGINLFYIPQVIYCFVSYTPIESAADLIRAIHDIVKNDTHYELCI